MITRAAPRFLLIMMVSVLAACSTQPSLQTKVSPYKAELNVPTLYLRGAFNWWGTVPAHQFKMASQRNSWNADIRLIADGQPYDFKVADTNWTPHQNCGAYNKVIEIDMAAAVPIHCSGQSANLRFTPPDNGVFRFILTEVKTGFYELSIAKTQ